MNSGDLAPALVMIVMSLTVGSILVLRSPLGRAIAERLLTKRAESSGLKPGA